MCNTAVMTDVLSKRVCKINESLFVSAILTLSITFSSSSFSSSSIMPSNRWFKSKTYLMNSYSTNP